MRVWAGEGVLALPQDPLRVSLKEKGALKANMGFWVLWASSLCMFALKMGLFFPSGRTVPLVYLWPLQPSEGPPCTVGIPKTGPLPIRESLLYFIHSPEDGRPEGCSNFKIFRLGCQVFLILPSQYLANNCTEDMRQV